MPQENAKQTPFYGYDFPPSEESESGDTLTMDLFLEDMDLE